jgi:hypothetical protein
MDHTNLHLANTKVKMLIFLGDVTGSAEVEREQKLVEALRGQEGFSN